MDRLWLILYLAAAGAAIVQAALMLLQTWENRRFARNRLPEWPPPQPVGHAVIFAPCKGLDVGLEQNLRALMTQDYDNYQVRFIVGGADDPVCPLLRRIMAEFPRVPARLVVAGAASESGQKVHNLRVATADLPPRAEYLAFVDSDARPRPQWLRSLICRLDQPNVGAATGYRWFVPGRPTLANHVLYAVNSSVGLMLGHGGRHLIWGGSWAIRREVFQRTGIREAWQGKLTEDLVAARQLTSRRLKILFEPACMVISPLDQNPADALSFMRRQYFLTRWYGARGVATVVCGRHRDPVHLALQCGEPAAGTVERHAAAASRGGHGGALRIGGRAELAPSGFGENVFPAPNFPPRAARRFDIWMGPLVGLLNWGGLISSLLGRRTTWRGISYEMGPGGNVRRVDLAHEQTIPPPTTVPAPVPAGVAENRL